MKFAVLAMLALELVLLFGCAQQSQPAQAGEPPSAPQQQVSATGTSGITPAVLAQHNREDDCWFAYRGKVYDSTGMIRSHKDYKELLVPLCGISGKFESAFEAKHGTGKVDALVGESVYMGQLVAEG